METCLTKLISRNMRHLFYACAFQPLLFYSVFFSQKLRARGLIVLTNCWSNLTVYNRNPSEKDKKGIINYFLKKFHLFKVDS